MLLENQNCPNYVPEIKNCWMNKLPFSKYDLKAFGRQRAALSSKIRGTLSFFFPPRVGPSLKYKSDQDPPKVAPRHPIKAPGRTEWDPEAIPSPSSRWHRNAHVRAHARAHTHKCTAPPQHIPVPRPHSREHQEGGERAGKDESGF